MVDISRVQDALFALEEGLELHGWDQPSKIFSITFENGNPIFSLIIETRDHPVNALRDLGLQSWDGIVIVTEAWTYPERLLDELNMVDGDDALTALWSIIPPSKHPQRVELRTVMATLRDGRQVAVLRKRGKEAEAWVEDGDASLDGRIPKAIAATLG